jgi:riboflavin kinase/FMN adenylyltransferase
MMQFPAHVERFEELAGLTGELHLAIGVFDGVHLGHKAVIESAVFSAQRSGGVSGVLTFDPHPSRLFRPDAPTLLMMPIELKTSMLHTVGVDVVIRKHFDRAFASIPAEDFLGNLKAALPALKSIYVGENFRFGKMRGGSIATLIESGNELGLGVFSVERIKHNGEPISSTRIRQDLVSGQIGSVNDLFGYNYSSNGQVVGGARLGRQIGFPTLNLPWDPECRPCFGVYHVRFRGAADQPWAFAVANYGVKPTVAEADQLPALEVHALEDTKLDCDDSIEVEWLRFIRPEQKFASLDALKVQIAKDCEIARGFSGASA